MLPFLKPRRQGTGIAVEVRKPDDTSQDAPSDGMREVQIAAADLIKAIQANDEKAAASALKAAFEILDSMPHDEGEHTNEE